MLNQALKSIIVDRLLPRVQTPAQYIGGEWNAVVKDHRSVRGKLCLAFPDAYSIGMSHHGLQVLYDVMNRRDDWACERAFTPAGRHGAVAPRARPAAVEPGNLHAACGVRRARLHAAIRPLLQQRPDDARSGRHSASRPRSARLAHPLVIAGGPCAVNPEPMSRFIDLFVIGDGEEALPAVCDLWLQLKQAGREAVDSRVSENGTSALTRAKRCSPRWPRGCRMPTCRDSTNRKNDGGDGRTSVRPTRGDVPERIEPAVVADLDALPPPPRPVVPYVECVQDRIAIEIMRGCPGKCRFCQSTTIKRPLRFRKVETIVAGGARTVPQHGLQRNVAPVALDQRLSPVRRVDAAAARDVSAAGRGHFAAEPADQRAVVGWSAI